MDRKSTMSMSAVGIIVLVMYSVFISGCLYPYQVTPNAVDLSTSKYFPPVGDQGGMGDCVEWDVVYYSLGYEVSVANNWTKTSSGDSAELLEPSYVYSALKWQSETTLTVGQTVIDTGAPTIQEVDEYSGGTPYFAAPYPMLNGSAPMYRAYSCDKLLLTTMEVKQIESLLVQGIPVVVSVDGGYLKNDMKDDALTTKDSTGTTDHVVTIVGYNKTMTIGGNVGVFKAVNSWGTGFGDNGYLYISFDYFDAHIFQMSPTYVVYNPNT